MSEQLMDSALRGIVNAVYPVGARIEFETDTDPNTLYPWQTWVQRKGEFAYAYDDSHAIGTTGGEATHTLSASEMPSHSHIYSNATGVQGHVLTWNEMPSHTHGIHWVGATPPQGGGSDQNFGVAQVAVGNQQSGSAGGNWSHNHGLSKSNANTTNTGSGAAHNNMPPYRAVAVWVRTA